MRGPAHARAVDQAGAVVAAVTEDQAVLPTLCRSWDVRAQIEHMINALTLFTAAAEGRRPAVDPKSSPVSGPWAEAFRARGSKLIEAWREAGDLTAIVHTSFADVPGKFVVAGQIAELTVHAWDLAAATGQNRALDPEVARHCPGVGRARAAPRASRRAGRRPCHRPRGPGPPRRRRSPNAWPPGSAATPRSSRRSWRPATHTANL